MRCALCSHSRQKHHGVSDIGQVMLERPRSSQPTQTRTDCHDAMSRGWQQPRLELRLGRRRQRHCGGHGILPLLWFAESSLGRATYPPSAHRGSGGDAAFIPGTGRDRIRLKREAGRRRRCDARRAVSQPLGRRSCQPGLFARLAVTRRGVTGSACTATAMQRPSASRLAGVAACAATPHGAIQQCHPRTNDGRGNQPPRTRRRQRQLAWLDIFTARGLVHA